MRYGWLDGMPTINRPFLPVDLVATGAAAGLCKMVFVECGCEPGQSLTEAEWVSALAKTEPRLRGIVAHAPLEKGRGIRDEIATLAALPLVKGVRRNLQGEADLNYCLQPEFIAAVELLAKYELTFDLCIRPEQLRAVTELARRVPQVVFILDHFGKPPVRVGRFEPWATDLKVFAGLPNTNCKISGLTTEADWKNWRPEHLKPYFDVALAAFGYDRVLFGGDWPVCTLATDYQSWVDTVFSFIVTATELDRQKMFQFNAERIYRI